MPEIETLYAFAVATLIVGYLPGPAIFYTAARTIAGGRGAGLFAALGIHVGCYLHVLAAAFGLSAIFAQAPLAYFALKICGALYLAWLGFGLLRDALRRGGAGEDPAALLERARRAPKSLRRAFAESIVVEILNPKVAIFFIAFLPQFVDPSAAWPLWAQFVVLGTIVNLTFSSADIVTVFVADRAMRAARRSRLAERVAKALGGSALLGLGAHLAASRAP